MEIEKRKDMNLFSQKRAKNQKPLPLEGFAELSDEQSESITGSGPGSPAAAQYRHDSGYEEVLQYGFDTLAKRSSQVTVVNQTVNYNNVNAKSSSTSKG